MSPRKGLRQSREGRRLVELRVGTSDEALVAGLANGDREAAAAFVRRFQKRVYGLALSIVGDAGTAEDVAQEAFTRAWRRADGYDARRGRVLTWLLTITRSAAIDVVRLRRAQPMDPELLATRLQLEENAASTGADGGLAERELLRDAPGRAACGAAAGDRAGDVLRSHGGRDRTAGGRAARDRQDPHPHRSDEAPRNAGGGGR